MYIKLLVSNAAAGSIIGKVGTVSAGGVSTARVQNPAKAAVVAYVHRDERKRRQGYVLLYPLLYLLPPTSVWSCREAAI